MTTTTQNRWITPDGFYVYPSQPNWNPANDDAGDTSVYNFCAVIRQQPIRLHAGEHYEAAVALGGDAALLGGDYDVQEETMVGTLYMELTVHCTVYATPNWEDPDYRPGLALAMDIYDTDGNQEQNVPHEYVLVNWTGNCAADAHTWRTLVAAFVIRHRDRIV